jgi:DNA-binding NarL/FixJ family response regulator
VPAETTHIVIIDDHPLVRAGMRQVLEAASGMAVVAEGATGADALHLIAQFHPNVLVLDVNLPDMSGVDVTRRLQTLAPFTAVVIFTVHNDRETALGLLEAGVVGYVLKDDAAETLANAVRAVAQGEIWISPRIAGQVIHRSRNEAAPNPLTQLTPRELEVLRLIAQGLNNETIAHTLTLARRTVQNHVSAIYGKLGITSRAEAVLIALRYKVAHVPPAETPWVAR